MTNITKLNDAHDVAYGHLHMMTGLMKAAFELQVEAASLSDEPDVQQAITACLSASIETADRAADAIEQMLVLAKGGAA